MLKLSPRSGVIYLAIALSSSGCGREFLSDGPNRDAKSVQRMVGSAWLAGESPSIPRPAGGVAPEWREESAFFMEAARGAWTYVEREYQARTGLVNSVLGYPYATTWDMASMLGAYYAAHELGLIDTTDYDARMHRALATLATLDLYQGGALNKNYSTTSGASAGRSDRESGEGYGWSAIDLGRLLVWLKIVEKNQPRFARAVHAVVDRLDFERLVRDGYLRGEDRSPGGRERAYQEGRLGYEQYAARGFALWGHPPEFALELSRHTEPFDVLGVTVLRDLRGGEHLTSEPMILMGLEVGWEPEFRDLAERLLAVQQKRYEETGQITIVSEDAMPDPPHYHYYYTVHNARTPFAVTALGQGNLDWPRWVSAKAAFGWHALLPSAYTQLAVHAVQPALGGNGWRSGIYEGSGQPTGSENVNTASVILVAALYQRQGHPILSVSPTEGRHGLQIEAPESDLDNTWCGRISAVITR